MSTALISPESPPAEALDLAAVDDLVAELGTDPSAAIPILQGIQRHYRYLPREALARVCELTRIAPAQLSGVATFYHQFRHRPRGEHLVRVCHGTACHVKGAERLTERLREHLEIEGDDDTDAARQFTVERVFCVGCCSLAPVMQVDDTTYGHVAAHTAPQRLEQFLTQYRLGGSELRGGAPALNGAGEVRLCLDSCCVARGCGDVNEALQRSIADNGLGVRLRQVGCVLLCEQTPFLEIAVPGQPVVSYACVTADAVEDILLRHFRPRGLRRAMAGVGRFLEGVSSGRFWEPEPVAPVDPGAPETSGFFARQSPIATEHYGRCGPLDLDAYLEYGGFAALRNCVAAADPAAVAHEIDASGLRGRGGAGFPSGRKWEIVRRAAGDRKYVICNGDEGDPGAFMDRMLLESFPFRVIEGMAIAAYAVGAGEGIFYVRAEYPAAVERLRNAIAQCDARGLLATDGFSIHMRVFEGAGAFVCGEETALLESLEGKRGIPRVRPPYPAERGLFGKPTLVNNVESLAVVPWIMCHGAEAFAAHGTATSAGTKVFALAGGIRRPGLIEVPMGITLREIVDEVGGGMRDGRIFKAVQIGGPAGGCVPASLADTPIDYEALREVGALMGSGGLVVLDDGDCMVDVARYFTTFMQGESCGQCTLCRVGTLRMLEILDAICQGRGRRRHLDDLEELARQTTDGSVCGLGRSAPNPVLTTLRYFRDEYEAHLEGRCPAGSCKDLIDYTIDDACTGCTICAQHCPVDAIPVTPYVRHTIDDAACTRCDACRDVCPVDAVRIEPTRKGEPA